MLEAGLGLAGLGLRYPLSLASLWVACLNLRLALPDMALRLERLWGACSPAPKNQSEAAAAALCSSNSPCQ
eukprot:2344772-Rhodomonas_salina.1